MGGDDEAAVVRQRRHADLHRALADRRGDCAADHPGEPRARPWVRAVTSHYVVEQSTFAGVARERREANVRTLDAEPPVVETDDRRRHRAVLEREPAEVAGRWRERTHTDRRGYVNERAVIPRAAGSTSSAKRCAISRYSAIVPERTSKCIVRCE